MTGALLLGLLAQVWVPPGPLTLAAATGIASLTVLGLSFLVPGRLRTTLAGFRFTSTLLIALAAFAIVGTLVLQGKPAALYPQRYGAVGRLIVALRLDDIFHGLPFAGLTALFGAAILSSAALRWPPSLKRAGFFLAHLGLLVSGAGAAASSVFSVRGRIDLKAGGDVATAVRVVRNGLSTGLTAPLGFDLRLDQFDLVNYEPEYRVGYYEKQLQRRDGKVVEEFRLRTSFDPDLASHRLPGGDAFRLKGIYPDFVSENQVSAAPNGRPALEVVAEGRPYWVFAGEGIPLAGGSSVLLFNWSCPPAPPGATTAILVCGGEKKVVIHTGDGEAVQPLAEGAEAAGGTIRFGRLLESAIRTPAYGTRSGDWNNPAALVETHAAGKVKEEIALANQPRGIFVSERAALVFERREREVKAFRSHVTARQGDKLIRAVVAVNEPFDFGGWTFYQVNYDPNDPSYSGLEAVRDPGVTWVFVGFTLICLGVAYLFYVEPRLRGGGIDRPTAPPARGPSAA